MNPPKKTLGRGLDHLISEASKVETPLAIASNRGFLQLPLDSLPNGTAAPSPSLAALTSSIQAHGMLQPILVRKHEAGYEVIDGHQRLLAAKAAGLRTVPAMILNAPASDVATLSAEANRHRPDVADPIPAVDPAPPPSPCVPADIPPATPRGWRFDWRLPASFVAVAGVAWLIGYAATLELTRASTAPASVRIAAATEPQAGTTADDGSLPLSGKRADENALVDRVAQATGAPASSPVLPPPTDVVPPWVAGLRIAGVSVTSTNGTAMVTFEAPVFSRYAAIAPSSGDTLKTLADALNRIEPPLSVRVVGHTDDKPVRASSLYRDNYALGLARALSVVQFLRYHAGLEDVALSAASAGEANPPFANDPASEGVKNRTVTLEISED